MNCSVQPNLSPKRQIEYGPFSLDLNICPYGVSFHGVTIHTSPSRLQAVLGSGLVSDLYKVSQEWIFTNDRGEIFTVYDWKQTRLYDNEGMPVDEFWQSSKPTDFHVGHEYTSKESAMDLARIIQDACDFYPIRKAIDDCTTKSNNEVSIELEKVMKAVDEFQSWLKS